MRFKLKEDEILEFLDLNFPQQTFEKGRLLIGQKQDLREAFQFAAENKVIPKSN